MWTSLARVRQRRRFVWRTLNIDKRRAGDIHANRRLTGEKYGSISSIV
jgi:hypothetical protein